MLQATTLMHGVVRQIIYQIAKKKPLPTKTPASQKKLTAGKVIQFLLNNCQERLSVRYRANTLPFEAESSLFYMDTRVGLCSNTKRTHTLYT